VKEPHSLEVRAYVPGLYRHVAACDIAVVQRGLALGAQAGQARVRGVVTDAGFRHFARVAETPLNIVYEARP
jgi:hypothetical protein